jgi:LysM repeat protein
VRAGENLFRIALRYGTTVDAIVFANGLNNARTVHAGQKLIIPQGSVAPVTVVDSAARGETYTVRPGDTLYSIARRRDVALTRLLQANALASTDTIYAGQRLVLPGEDERVPPADSYGIDVYVVQVGDTLAKIASDFVTTTEHLAHLNGIANPTAIRPGQVLRLSEAVPRVAIGGKRIVMDLSEQHLYAYERNRMVYSFVASSGAAPSYTRVGEFRVQRKIPKAYGSTWDIWMPHWLGIYWAGSTENGIHALPILPSGQTLWAGYLGRPVSYGCIVLGSDDAKTLYNWAEVGTPVSIRN